MKKIIFICLILLASLVVYLVLIVRPVEGVEVDRYYFKTYNLVEEYQYYRNIRLVVFKHDAEALQQFINADCDGSGCYAHGKTLVQILIKVGDEKFSQLSKQLHDAGYLYSLLRVGHEYGNFPTSNNEENFRENYPLTFKKIEN
jgi:hypothetical protein